MRSIRDKERIKQALDNIGFFEQRHGNVTCVTIPFFYL